MCEGYPFRKVKLRKSSSRLVKARWPHERRLPRRLDARPVLDRQAAQSQFHCAIHTGAHLWDSDRLEKVRLKRSKRTRYSEVSATQRETAVTIFRGAKRVDCATSQLWTPEIANVRPSITARYPCCATFSALIPPNCLNSRDCSVPARLANPVCVAPGQKHVTVTPECCSSLAIASEKEMTYALVA